MFYMIRFVKRCFGDRQKHIRGTAPVRGPAVGNQWFISLGMYWSLADCDVLDSVSSLTPPKKKFDPKQRAKMRVQNPRQNEKNMRYLHCSNKVLAAKSTFGEKKN